jgi:hypothetical protein
MPPEEESEIRDLQDLLRETGGIVYLIDNPSEMSVAAHSLANELSHYYILQISAPVSNKSSHLRIDVRDPGGKKRRGLTVTFPRILLPALCSG